MMKLKALLLVLLFFISTCIYANDSVRPLPAQEAFALSAQLDESNSLILKWIIAPGYYLYSDKLNISSPQGAMGIMPEFKEKTLSGVFQAPVFIKDPNKTQILAIHYQGCASKGFCYPPMTRYLTVNLKEMQGPLDLTDSISNHPQHNGVGKLFQHSFFVTLLIFLGLGLLLAFTPCVLPMVPILSAIIIGQGRQISTLKAFFLSLAYVLGMASAYAIAGIITALFGSNLQVIFQKPMVIGVFGVFLLLLALSMFGLYELRLPHSWSRRLTRWSHRHQGETYGGLFVMGALSILIVSPCVTAPLVGVLAYIANTGNVILGGSALLVLGLGMGIPLLLVGVSAGKLLPKTGHWMNTIKKLLGIMILVLAAWTVTPIIPGMTVQHSSFAVVKTMSELDKQLAFAKANKKQVILDFYADWCKSCVIMEHEVFNKIEIQNALNQFVLLRVDVTKNSAADQEILQHFHVIAPPTILFFDVAGNEITQHQIVGEVNAKQFLADLAEVNYSQCKNNARDC